LSANELHVADAAEGQAGDHDLDEPVRATPPTVSRAVEDSRRRTSRSAGARPRPRQARGSAPALGNPWLVATRWLRLTVAKPGFIWAAGGLAGIGGFAAVLWLTEPVPPLPPGAAKLASLPVADAGTLSAAAYRAGLHGSPAIKGGIDKMKRQDDGRVLVKGWVADIAAKETPLTLMAFSGGRNVLTMTTGGARHDLSHALGLADAAATNPMFQTIVPCERGHRLMVIAVAPDNSYAQVGSPVCP
jgi:hypothetical protein